MKLLLTHKINKFYNIFHEVLGYKLTITSHNLKDKDLLSQILYDISEALEGYDYDEPCGMFKWLTKLYAQVATAYDTTPRNYTLPILVVLAIVSTLVGCSSRTEATPTPTEPTETTEPKVHTRYTEFGRYYTEGTVITDDGNEWSYTTDTISDKTPTDRMPVWIGFDDNGTPEDIYDDIVLGLVYDVYTAIYDALETELSEEFEVEREGNYIKLITNVESTESGVLYTFANGTGYYSEY
jgi:hypothetical protein